MQMRVGAALCCAAGIAFGAFQASADTVTDLSGAIKLRFNDGGYTQGKLGNDWCFNVETEPGFTYWYYSIGQTSANLKATKIQHSARIQATYFDTTANMTKYASVFLGLDIPDGNVPYKPFDLNQAPLGRPQTVATPPAAATASSGLQEPPADQTRCMTFAQFLNAYALPFTLKVGTVAQAGKDTASENYSTGARYWTFAGRPHAVVAIAEYPIKLEIRLANGDLKEVDAKLVVGFGGGAGP